MDVLVATTVIENGIDMPNVNTIIVLQAERFGMSALYQLRGRVGRSPRYSIYIYPNFYIPIKRCQYLCKYDVSIMHYIGQPLLIL